MEPDHAVCRLIIPVFATATYTCHRRRTGRKDKASPAQLLRQRRGDPVEEIRQGDVVWIPPGQKHWHGAAPNAAMTHIAIVERLDGKTSDWMERVSDAQYGAPLRAQEGPPAPAAQARPSQKAIGDFAPKLAEITDDVLYADVWERPQLRKRDRSLVTAAALIALNRPDQLRSHFARARANGVTQEELIEAITHLAFYAG